MRSRKGTSLIWNVLVVAILVVIVMVVLVPFFQKSVKTTSPIIDIGKQSTDTLKDQLKGSGASGPEGQTGQTLPEAKSQEAAESEKFFSLIERGYLTAADLRFVYDNLPKYYPDTDDAKKSDIKKVLEKNLCLLADDSLNLAVHDWLKTNGVLINDLTADCMANTMIAYKERQAEIEIISKRVLGIPPDAEITADLLSRSLNIDKNSDLYTYRVYAMYNLGSSNLNALSREMYAPNELPNAEAYYVDQAFALYLFPISKLQYSNSIHSTQRGLNLKCAKLKKDFNAKYTANPTFANDAEEDYYNAYKLAAGNCEKINAELNSKLPAEDIQ